MPALFELDDAGDLVLIHAGTHGGARRSMGTNRRIRGFPKQRNFSRILDEPELRDLWLGIDERNVVRKRVGASQPVDRRGRWCGAAVGEIGENRDAWRRENPNELIAHPVERFYSTEAR